MGDHRLGVAVDLWAARVLSGLGTSLPVRQFRRAVALALIMLGPVTGAATFFVLDRAAMLFSGAPANTGGNPEIAALLAALLAVSSVYLSFLDLARTHVSAASQVISKSPLKGIWLACDIGLWRVVIAERGAALAVRATVQASTLAAAGLYLHRARHSAAQDVLAMAVLLPVGYLCAALALAAVHASSRAEVAPRSRVLVWLIPVNVIGGALLARALSSRAGATPQLGDALSGAGGLVNHLGLVRLAAVVFVVASMAALVAVVASDRSLNPQASKHFETHSTRQRGPTLGLPGLVLRGVGGIAAMPVARRAVGAALAVAALLVGWRIGGGPALPDPLHPAASRALGVVGLGMGMAVSAGVLNALGQTSRLWHYRALREAGATTRDLWMSSLMPTILLGGVAASVLSLGAWAVLGRPTAVPALVLSAAMSSEHLVDSLFARGGADEGSRATNSLLAVVGYLLTLPALMLVVNLTSWAAPALVVLVIVQIAGGMWWFRKRLDALPLTAVE